jgi:hypothetical protein
MQRRLVLGTLALAALALTAGCLGFGTGPVDAETLDAEPASPYAWDAQTDVHIAIQDNAKFRAVYSMNQSSIELFRRDGFGGRNPLDVEAVRYQYPNGTVVNGSEMRARGGEVSRTRDVVSVALPSNRTDGRLAFTAGSTPKRFSLPVFVEGTYEVVLPPNRRVGMPVFGQVSPRGYETSREGQVTHIRWSEAVTSRSVLVQFYLERDLTIFAGLVVVFSLVGGGGLLYYRRQIEALREQREELGLDVETDDDEFDRGPPPGMR